jgi:hypothetical protein
MEGSADAGQQRRCATCGALVTPDADWCGQCFAPLVGDDRLTRGREPAVDEGASHAEASASAPVASPAIAALGSAADRPVPLWPCPVCGHENPVDLDACAVCGTSFATLMRSGERPSPVDPMRALRRSLIFPGLGHGLVGRSLDGLARGILFVVLAAMAVMVLVAGLTSAVLVTVLALFAGMAVVVYLGSAWEAFRLAAGEPPFVSSRALPWATVAVVMLSVALLTLAIASPSRR